MTQPDRASTIRWQDASPRYRVVIAVWCVIALGALPLAVWINQTQDLPITFFQWVAILAGIIALDRPSKAWPRVEWVAKVIAGAYLVAGLLFIVF